MVISNSCMGIYAFTEEIKSIFNSIVKPVVETHTGLIYIDALSYYESNNIKMDLINKMIEESTLLIVDISILNANVFFEFGIGYSLKKPSVIICSMSQFKKKWKRKLPFDISGRELLIYNDDNDLKVKLGKSISDSLFKTQIKTSSWISENKTNHIKSSTEIDFHDLGKVWSNIGFGPNITLSYHVHVNEILNSKLNPDIRLFFSDDINSYTEIMCVFPWEHSEIDINKYECHIDFKKNKDSEAIRIQQVTVGQKNIETIKDFHVFVSFYWPNLVFESTFFENNVSRLLVPLSELRDKLYPIHHKQFIGFEVRNCNVTIDEIIIKEIFL